MPFNAIPSGQAVCVHGLQGAPQHNGKRGKVTELDQKSNRYVVDLADGTSVSLKPDNLTQCVQNVTVSGIGSKPELNGSRGAVIGWDGSERYQIRLDNGQIVALKPANIILPTSTRVMINGLTKGVQYNGQWGKIVGLDDDVGRCLVQVDQGGSQLKLKFENLKA